MPWGVESHGVALFVAFANLVALIVKTLVKSLGTKVLISVIVAMAALCAFDGPGVQASPQDPLQEESAFCAILDGGSLETARPIQAIAHPPLGEPMGPLPVICPRWFLAQSVDHPPELPA